MRQQSEGKFEELRGKIRSTWGNITDEDIEKSRGDVEQLVGKIKEKTGESTQSIKARLEEMMEKSKRKSA